MNRSLSLVTLYYGITPAFMLAEVMWGWDLRIPLLDSPVWRGLYYLLCILLTPLAWRWPHWLPLAGMIESSINLLLLILSVMLPIFYLPAMYEDTLTQLPFQSPGDILRFLLPASVGLYCFYLHSAQLQRRR